MKRIGIRVDGDSGAEIGMGHVYRSIAIARLLFEKIRNVEIQFFMREFPEGITKVGKEGYPVQSLPIRPIKFDYETAFEKHKPDILIIDTLGSNNDLMESARSIMSSIVTLDDLTYFAKEADVVVNGILWATRQLPKRMGRAKVYQGIEYMPLMKQFAVANRKPRYISREVKEIIVSTGGADGRGFTMQLMDALREISFKCHVNVMVGPAFTKVDNIKRRAGNLSKRVTFSVIENTTTMADYMIKADLALLTGGTVMFESAACGTPAVIVSSYEHQAPQAEWFHKHGIVFSLGCFPKAVDQKLVVRAIEKIAADLPDRHEMSATGKQVVDGQGMYRLMEIIKSQLEKGS